MWRVPSERIALDLDGPSVEVERLHSWAVQQQVLSLVAAYDNAKNPAAEYNSLTPLVERFVAEAQPSWEITDHRGSVPATPAGMLRLPQTVIHQIIARWLESLPVPNADEPPSAVDAVIPPGPANREIKRRLRAVKAA